LFGSSPKDNAPQKFRIAVLSQGNLTTVSVQNADGSTAPAEQARRIVQVIADDLK
jgi:outer membrane protein assembly factor BamC